MFCWETLGPGIHADGTLTLTTYRDVVADQVRSPTAVSALSRITRPATLQNIVQEWFGEHHQEAKVLIWPPNSPDLTLMERLWDELGEQV